MFKKTKTSTQTMRVLIGKLVFYSQKESSDLIVLSVNTFHDFQNFQKRLCHVRFLLPVKTVFDGLKLTEKLITHSFSYNIDLILYIFQKYYPKLSQIVLVYLGLSNPLS